LAGSWSFFCLVLSTLAYFPRTFPYFSLNFSSVPGREFTLYKVYSYIQRHIMPCCAKLVWCCLNLNLMPCPAVQVPENFMFVCSLLFSFRQVERPRNAFYALHGRRFLFIRFCILRPCSRFLLLCNTRERLFNSHTFPRLIVGFH
jgi:hypothetical protein